jgi:hypothetical protein
MHYVNTSRTPLWFYSGFLIIPIAVALFMHFNQKANEEYIHNPKEGDVYLLELKDGSDTFYRI